MRSLGECNTDKNKIERTEDTFTQRSSKKEKGIKREREREIYRAKWMFVWFFYCTINLRCERTHMRHTGNDGERISAELFFLLDKYRVMLDGIVHLFFNGILQRWRKKLPRELAVGVEELRLSRFIHKHCAGSPSSHRPFPCLVVFIWFCVSFTESAKWLEIAWQLHIWRLCVSVYA